MSKGIFSDEFTDVFGDILADVFSDGFPAASGNAPDPDPQGSAKGPGGANGGSMPIDLSAPDGFDFDLPSEARVPFESDSAGAVATDFGQLLMGKPGGDGGGGGGKPDGGGGGGGGKPDKGDGGSQTASETYVSGADDVTNTDNFNISVEFYGDYSSGTKLALAGYVKAAAEFLSSLIEVGLPDDPNMFRSFDTATKFEVDDLHLEIYVDKFKGPGSATIAAGTDIYAANDWDGNWPGGSTPLEDYTETPAGATITFNQSYIDTLDANGTLDDVVLHEMMHALYFGLWETAENDLIDDAGVYQGTLGSSAEYSSGDLVVEDEGLAGSVGAHWAEAVFDKELMTSVVETTDDMYLSYFSVATLADLQIIDATDVATGNYNTRGYTLDANWKTLVDGLNGTVQLANGDTDTGIGIDLDYWADNVFA